jgi:hypothetical protein
MEHVVFFPGPDGAPSFRRLPSLEDAVRMVEHLRNVEGVSEVSVHTLSEVPLAFRPYYRVEVPVGEAPVADVAAPVAAAVPAPAQPVGEHVPAEAAPVAVAATEVEQGEPAANGRRSLGFFSH